MYLLLLAVAFLPASVAAEKSNEIQSLQLDEEIKHALDSALEKNPEIENCKIVVNLILEKDRQTSKWNGKIDKLEVEVVEVGLNEDQPDEVDSTMTSPVADESNSEIGNDNNKSSKGNILGWLIAVAFLVILLIAVVPRMRTNVFKDKQIPDISGKHHKGHHHGIHPRNELQTHDNKQQNNRNAESATTQKEQVVTINPKIVQQQTVDKPVREESSEKTSTSVEPTSTVDEDQREPAITIPEEPIIKYGQIAVLSQDELATEEDYMSDDAAGMPFEFCFTPNMEQGTYDISRASRMSFLRDISIIRPFVQNFDDVSNPTEIVTVSKGKLRRKGFSWIVTEKLKIKLS